MNQKFTSPAKTSHTFTRPPLRRMLHVHQLLQAGAYPSCPGIARQFEVSVRTIKRDFDYMRDSMGLPIAYDRKRYGFYYTQEVTTLPSFAVSEAEVFALMIAHKGIAQYQGTPLQEPLEAAFRKLTGQLDRQVRLSLCSLDEAVSFRPFAPEDTDLAAFETLTRAVHQRRAVTFSYRNLGAVSAEPRRVHPYHLTCIENHWYLFAFDVNRGAMRTFSLARLGEPVLTKERFKRTAQFKTDDYLRGSFCAFKGTDDYEVVVEFDAWAADLIRGRRWHTSQELTNLPGGCLRLRMRLNSIEEVDRWVLSWGTHASVVRPQALVTRLAEMARVLHERYTSGEMADAA